MNAVKLVPCPDCAAEPCPAHGGVHHEPTCLLGRALDKTERKDLRWFADRPRAEQRVRPTTWAEQASIETATGFRPTHAYVKPGGRDRLVYGYGNNDGIRVFTLSLAGGHDG